MKEKLLGKTLDELKQAAVSAGLPSFVGAQLADWMYGKRTAEAARMTNVSKAAKAALGERFDFGFTSPSSVVVSSDGTSKYLFPVTCPVPGGEQSSSVEAVVIPDGERRTLCVSSQAGCKMGCRFCMTGRQGWRGNLDAAHILSQFLGVEDPLSLTNAVFMGMGEPLDNYDTLIRVLEVLTAPWGFGWSPKRITVSTIGVLPALKKLLEQTRCHVAVSLHNPFGEQRLAMMPSEKAWPLRDVVSLLKRYDFSGQRRVSFEYTMFDGWNDSLLHADALVRLLGGLECRVNLIRFHRIPDFPYGSCPDSAMEAFRDYLCSKGLTCTIRASRGEDIFEACGLLAGKHDDR